MITDQSIKAAIREAKTVGKPLKRCSESGMYVLANPNGSALWRFKYMLEGREKLIGLGAYDVTPLKTARERRDAARKLVADGIDPSAVRKAERAAQSNTVEAVAESWLLTLDKLSAGTVRRHRARLSQFVFPKLGNRPIAAVTAGELRGVLDRIKTKAFGGYTMVETAHRVFQLCGSIWQHARLNELTKDNITTDLAALYPQGGANHRAAIIDPREVGELLRAIDAYHGQPATHAALKLAPLLFVRPGELRKMEWAELDLDADQPVWRIPAAKMKMKSHHVVPLATQAVTILRAVQAHARSSAYVFPALTSSLRPMSENTVNQALRRMGYTGDQHVGHGFRTTASTMLNEMGWNMDAIELQLAHQDRNKVRAAYNQAQRLEERRTMMQAWADHLDKLRQARAAS